MLFKYILQGYFCMHLVDLIYSYIYIPLQFRYYSHNVVWIILPQCYTKIKHVYEKKTAYLIYVRPMVNTVWSVYTGRYKSFCILSKSFLIMHIMS